MFAIGDYVISGSNGICLVQDITTLNISGVDKNRKYYLLKPVFASGSTVYVPLDTADTTMRKALSKEEALSVIKSIPQIPFIPLADEKTLERTYKEYIRQNSCEGWIKPRLSAQKRTCPLWTSPFLYLFLLIFLIVIGAHHKQAD